MNDRNIRSTFSPKSDLALAGIMKKNNLEGSSIGFLLEKITMFFSRAEISEKEMISSIQKEIGISPKMASQIATEIKNTLIPTLWNNLSPEEKESLLHGKKVKVGDVLSREKTMPSNAKKDFDYEPPKKSGGPDKYRESI